MNDGCPAPDENQTLTRSQAIDPATRDTTGNDAPGSGAVCLVLHAHLPFVRHPEYPDMMEERWLFEAITETYVPLLEVFCRLHQDGLPFRLTMSLTPPLTAMLNDPLLQDRYQNYLQKMLELAHKEVERTRWQPQHHVTACYYRERLVTIQQLYLERFQRDLVAAFKHFQDLNHLEIITCTATHGYLPLMNTFRPAVEAQIAVAVEDYQRNFSRSPQGIWLAECAFQPGDDQILARYGLRYFFADAHGLLHADPAPRYGVYAPIYTPAGVAVFGRDAESSKQVWSAHEGYPGDFDYREFYRDIGFDLDFEYVRPYIHESGLRLNTGIKYHRITGRQGDEKQPYNVANAMTKADIHAQHFVASRMAQIRRIAPGMAPRQPLIVAPYDAELFGHWWYEGPEFLHRVLRRIAEAPTGPLRLATPCDYLAANPVNQMAVPSSSSWGASGFHGVWLDSRNDWIYRHLHEAATNMIELADRFPQAEGLRRRALDQAARELLLAQASDWAFIMKTGTTVEYAEKRTRDHCFRFQRLYQTILADNIDENWLQELEWRDNIFPWLDYRVYRSDNPAGSRDSHNDGPC